MRAQLTSGVQIRFKFQLDQSQRQELRGSKRLSIHLFNAFGLGRVCGGPREMIKVLCKIECSWFNRWSENSGRKANLAESVDRIPRNRSTELSRNSVPRPPFLVLQRQMSQIGFMFCVRTICNIPI